MLAFHFLSQSFTDASCFCSETIAFIYFKLRIYVYKSIYFRICLFAFRLTWISICILHLLLLCNFFMRKELRFWLTGNKVITIMIIIIRSDLTTTLSQRCVFAGSSPSPLNSIMLICICWDFPRATHQNQYWYSTLNLRKVEICSLAIYILSRIVWKMKKEKGYV